MTIDQRQDAAPLATRAATGVAWLTAQTWVAKAGGFVTLIVLARLLAPADFGLVAAAMTVVSLLSLIADLGFGTYLTQVAELTPRIVNTAFWYALGSGLVLAGGLAAAAPLVESMFGVPGLAGVVLAISPAVLLVSAAAVPIALLRRRLRFRALALQAAAAAVIAQVVAIALAVAGLGVWALVAQVVVAQTVTLVACAVTARWRPSREVSLGELGVMTRFGTSVVAINLIASARLAAENALISQVLGAAALGQMSVAQRLVQTTQEVAGAAIAPVSTVVFAQVRDDAVRLRRGYDRALGLVYVVLAPALTLILVGSPLLVPLLFGAQWTSLAPVASVLAVAAIFTVTATLDHGLFLGAGRPGRWLAYASVTDAVTLAVTAVLVGQGILAVAIGFAGVAAVATAVRSVLVVRLIGARPWAVLRRTLAAVVCMGVSAACGYGVLALTAAWPPVAALAAAAVTVVGVHLGLAGILLAEGLSELVRQVRGRLPGAGVRA